MSGPVSNYERLMEDIFVHGSLSLALAVSKETGLLKLLCQAPGHLSSTQLAEQGQLKERYVREILNALATGGLVELEEGTGTADKEEARYFVPQVNRAALENAGVGSLLAINAARHYDDVKECFPLDGPSCFRYTQSSLTRLQQFSTKKIEQMVAIMLNTVEIKDNLEKGMKAMEVGCGTHTIALCLAATYPRSHFTITDISPEMLEVARVQAESQGVTNVTFELLDLCKFPDDSVWQERFDLVMGSDVIHDLPHVLRALQGIWRSLKPGGYFAFNDSFASSYVAENKKDSLTPALYTLSTFRCLPESFQDPNSDALGLCWGKEKAFQLLQEAGFTVRGLTRYQGDMYMRFKAVCICQRLA